MLLSRALRVRGKVVLAFVGGGGKTTAMFRLADELVAQNKRVITTTTTRLFISQTCQAPHHLVFEGSGAGSEHEFADRVRAAQNLESVAGHLLITGPEGDDGKVLGVPPDLIDELAALDVADAIIVEADGARERPFKAPAPHEPVLPSSTTVLVPVMGARALDAPLDAEHVHRPELVARLAGARLGESITPALAARVLAHPEGGLKGKPEAARAVVLVNQVQTAQEHESARTLARLLLAYDVISAVAIGAVGTPTPVQEAHRRVAAIILAAGASTRMEGRVKQLLPWRGKTLVENAIEVAVRSSANQVVSVLGAHADQVRVRIQRTPARVIINPVWEEGQASSVRAGLAALSASVDAAIFMNTDQPFLTTGILDAVIHRYWVTDAAIVASRFAGQRGSPVLFNRGHWPELMALQGEQGGRVLLDRYPEQVEWVDFPDARAGIDVDTYAEYESLLRSEN